jgi:hypothetical protein
MPRRFFERHVRPNYEEWLASPLNERLAKNAVADTNNMAARVFHYWRDRDPGQLYGATDEGRYRNELAIRECNDFALVRDVAEAHKHVTLTRKSRKVTRSDQTTPGATAWGEVGYGEGVYGGGPQLVVTLDNGTKRPLTAIVGNVISMWEHLLARWGL